jgi:nickel-dependent lactate racemase
MTEQQVSDHLDALCQQIAGYPVAARPGRSMDCPGNKVTRVLAIIPDATRTAPVPLLFRLLCEKLQGQVASLTFLIALGTHALMSPEQIAHLVGMDEEERERRFPGVTVENHRWDLEETFVHCGELSQQETQTLSDGKLSVTVPIRVNKKLLEADTTVILGPVFPHEVAGFSGGHKYLFPGIGGSDVIHFTHWLGALATSAQTIGVRDTAVRQAIELAASRVPGRRLAICMVTTKDGLHGLFAGEVQRAWKDAAELSSQVHIRWCDKPYRKVLSLIPERYSDLWTGAKGMYKVEPVVADGGEVVLLAPHIREFSSTHGKHLERIGYHVRDYFVKQWEQFKDVPWGVLAHSTHLRGEGLFENGQERPRVKVTLASAIDEETCRKMNLGYLDPGSIKVADWEGQDGVLVVHNAGEILYRLKT